MKTEQNRMKVKTCLKNYMVLTTAICLALFCLIAEGQHIRFNKVKKQAIVDFKPIVKPNSQTLVEYMTCDNLVDWRCEKVGLVGADGQVQWILDSGDSNAKRKFVRFVQTDISEAGNIDNDGDFISSVYELLNGTDPLSPLQMGADSNGNVSDLVTVTVADTELAAGGFEAPPYQTRVTVNAPPHTPLKVWVEGESGKLRKPNGDSFLAGNMAIPSKQALQVVSNSEGIAELVLTSSEVINDSCAVRASIGDIFNSDVTRQVGSERVQFMQGDMTLNFDQYPLPAGGNAKAIVRRSFKEKPLPGHKILLSVNSAKINDEVFTESDSLQDLITIGPGDSDASSVTNEKGECQITFNISSLESLEMIELAATDSSQIVK